MDAAQLAPKMRKGVMLAGMTGRAEISHFAIAGKALIGFHLFSRSPGIRGVDFSFLEPPTVDVQVRAWPSWSAPDTTDRALFYH